jgi:uncharacterized membrane protein YdcZ (DUF606 family)
MRLISESLGVPVAMTIQAYVLINFLFIQQKPMPRSYALEWGALSAGMYFLGFASWSEESQKLEAQGFSLDQRTGWALLGGVLCGLLVFATAFLGGLPPGVLFLSPIERVICGLCIFGQQICFWIAACTDTRVWCREQRYLEKDPNEQR